MKKKPYIIAFFFFIVDFISKLIISNKMGLGNSKEIIKDFFYITYTRNNGAAWSILKDQRILLLIITVIALFLINKFMNKEKLDKYEEVIYGMIIGGIVGNLFDRIIYHSVTDFLDFHLLGYHYPIFNFADTFIVLGIILLIIWSYRKEHYERDSNRRERKEN